MVSTRPLLYLSLPGVAFILGMFWFRRRNKNRITNADDEKATIVEPQVAVVNKHSPTETKSMQIKRTNHDDADDDNQANKLFGKSAPIQIVQNGVCNGGVGGNKKQQQQQQQHQQQLDSEVLKSRIQDVEHKILRSIEEDFENLSSPLDLPDSVNRVSFYTRKTSNSNADEPVIIKATTTPKISPENSFMECKYTKESKEQNNNINDTTDKIVTAEPISQLTEQTQKLEKLQQQQLQQQQQKQTAVDKTDSKIDANGNVNPASPALSMCSVQTGDSGKGGSLPRSEVANKEDTNNNNGRISYEFFFPTSLIGQLYGRHRTFINYIKAKTNAKVTVSKSRFAGKLRICSIDGTAQQIEDALALIRQRMPKRRYPNLSMQQIQIATPHAVVSLSTENMLSLKLHLIEGINNDVIVSTVVAGGHFFVQQPLHPSHPHLALQQKALYDRYNTEAPALPSLQLNAVCVAPVNNAWYRVEIVDLDNAVQDEQYCFIKFLDYGGFMSIKFNELRQIHADFMTLPFQATECVLSNVQPTGSQWAPEVTEMMTKLSRGIVLQAQVAGYTTQNLPEVYLFACLGAHNVVFINKELVARKLANWIDDFTPTL